MSTPQNRLLSGALYQAGSTSLPLGNAVKMNGCACCYRETLKATNDFFQIWKFLCSLFQSLARIYLVEFYSL